MWIDFLTQNRGAPWKTFHNVYVMADVASDASGRCYAGVVNFPEGLTKITAGEFSTSMLLQDIQVKEGEALRATLSMMVNDSPQDLQGKTLIYKIDNQALKAVLEKKGTSHNLELNRVGEAIFWLTQIGQFHLDLEYVESKNNVADKFTRQSRPPSHHPTRIERLLDRLERFADKALHVLATSSAAQFSQLHRRQRGRD